jgi:hypothetical protein
MTGDLSSATIRFPSQHFHPATRVGLVEGDAARTTLRRAAINFHV